MTPVCASAEAPTAAKAAAGMVPWAVSLLSILTLLASLPSHVEGQEGCVLGDRGRNDTFIQTLPGIGTVTYIGGA